jgi:hypothetical protein
MEDVFNRTVSILTLTLKLRKISLLLSEVGAEFGPRLRSIWCFISQADTEGRNCWCLRRLGSLTKRLD